MDDCCIEFCKKLDEWIQDEENATKEYHSWAKKAKNNNQPLVGTILETLSIDENKHGHALMDIAMQVCKSK